MLRLARLRGADLAGGSLRPRKDGPLIEELSGGEERGFSGGRTAGAPSAATGVEVTGTGSEAVGADGGSSEAPHMPQKRF